ncbi:MAG: Flp pilus assembly protein CpaB [Neomegalonema sp.]
MRYVILAVAIDAGVGAVALVQGELQRAREAAEQNIAVAPPPPPAPVAPKAEVLVASRDMRRGETVGENDLRWQPWPLEAVSEFYITREQDETAVENMMGVIVRSDFVPGEPITESKLLRLDNPSIMAAMLREGMRALSVRIVEETAAGGFILPGDYVDVILTREVVFLDGDGSETEAKTTNTLMRSVRVLAIGQTFSDDGETAAVIANSATLEVTPEQAEILSLAEQSGQLNLALRGVAELFGEGGETPIEPEPETAYDLRALSDEEGIKEQAELSEVVVIRGHTKQLAIVD